MIDAEFIFKGGMTLVLVSVVLVAAIYALGFLRATFRHKRQLDKQARFNNILLHNMAAGVVACDSKGELCLFNDVAVDWHGADATRLPQADWSKHYDLFEADGTTPLTPDRIPLLRAFRGQPVRGQLITIAPKHKLRRLVSTNADAILDSNGQRIGAVAVMHDMSSEWATRQELEQRAYIDEQTCLLNRAGLTREIEKLVASGAGWEWSWAVLFLIDISGFRRLNQALGYDIGDTILAAVGNRLRGLLPPEASLARIGADEFGVLLGQVSTNEGAARAKLLALAESVQRTIGEPLDIGPNNLRLKLSIGASLFSPSSMGGDELLAQSGLALGQAKASEATPIVIYDSAMRDLLIERRALSAALEAALDNDEIEVVYQPQCNRAGRVVGVEALSRWAPDGVPCSPVQFISIAEDSGEIIRIGQSVLRKACAQLVAWAGDPSRAGLSISVNVSAQELEAEDFALRTIEIVQQSGAPVDRLHLEITESLLLKNTEHSIQAIRQLRQNGLRVVLDDFGTGYSSLAYLAQLRVDALKIDRGFTARAGDGGRGDILLQSIVSLAKQLDLQIVAEGIESIEQLGHLEQMGCTLFQGFLFTPGVPADDVKTQYSLSQPGYSPTSVADPVPEPLSS